METRIVDNAEFIKQQAQAIGFDLCGIAPAVGPASWPDFTHWLDAGFAGEMHYLEKRRAAYQHPRFVLGSVRSVIMVAVCYDPQPEAAGTPSVSSVGRIARYARGLKDYHDVLRSLLKRLADKLHAHVPGCRTRGVVDTAPLLERDFARQAGLGWFGKNTMLINKHKGSYFSGGDSDGPGTATRYAARDLALRYLHSLPGNMPHRCVGRALSGWMPGDACRI
ncbi:MAG: DUF1730 domain-containing protein [Planctomycetaceae bacterium]